MTYSQAIGFLNGLLAFGAKFGLENARRLAAAAGHPERRLRFIHVAGTNGKGSTCAMLESIYRAAGLKVGLYTSPHLVCFAERIQVNRRLISESDVARLAGDMALVLKGFPPGSPLTFFEVVTVMALRYFEEQQCDLVVWETGLGGRFDATNIVTPLASVITNIGLEHQQWLGDTHERIAEEKAGIIKPGIPVITAAEPRRGLEVIARVANECDSRLTVVGREDIPAPLLDAAKIPLLGEHQRLNGAVAVATVRALDTVIPVSQDAIVAGLSSVSWPGRMQLAVTAGGQRILLDGAHNLDGARALASAFQLHFSGVRPTLILGVLADKDWRPLAELLVPLAGRILLVPVDSSRSLAPVELAPVCHAVNPSASVETCETLPQALQISERDPFLLITGSLYLVGQAVERLGIESGPAKNERGLNEWSPKQ